ncbi:TonB-dependent receptor [Novosphingobium sp. G106]|uniref:TonB-dependent receptor n=1 Tax=Novosphingobium sp. G106 TaxID=2849500 RepID=UPI001C2D23F6|nr:TonB-dependent receptor [Novosphingobium sp. G106]MBV1687946.1 TonB-dependent receptor [Novosphingobium sp. G106]
MNRAKTYRGFRVAAVLAGCLLAAQAPLARAQDRDDDDDDDDVRPSSAPAEIVITARRLDAARADIEPDLGASTFSLSNEAIERRPAGETASLAQVMLQMPGVAQTGKGQIGLRGSQGGIQYRINNVILPDGIDDLGEQLSPRMADKIQLITGALPAQYGLQVGGVVNITTKNGLYGEGSQLELYGGGAGQIEPAVEIAGASGSTSYFATGSYLHDAVGMASPNGAHKPDHDRTDQFEGLTFLDHVIDDASRVSLVAGLSDERFEIPENPKVDLSDPAQVSSANPIDAGRLYQRDFYGALSYLRSEGASTMQVSVYGRLSHNTLRSGASTGVFQTGLGGETTEDGAALGVQAEGAFKLGAQHTLRAGGIASYNRLHSRLDGIALSSVAPTVVSFASVDRVHRDDASLFVQDEWKPTDRLTLNYGLRFDRIAGFVDGNAFGPRASLVWSGPQGFTLHAGYARYLVAPNLFAGSHAQALAAASGGRAGESGAPLRLERDNYYDAGLQRKIGEFTIGLDAFWRDADNFLSETQDGSPLLAKPFNYRKARIRGAVVSMTYANGHLSAWANATLTQARATGLVSGQAYFPPAALALIQNNWGRPEGTQRLSGSTGATYSLGALSLSAEMLYGSGEPRALRASSLQPSSLPGYVQVNLALTCRLDGLRHHPLDLRLDAINLLDRRYEISDESKVGLPQWGPRRAIFVGVEQSF